MKNPFNAQGPSDPKYYANRQKLLNSFKETVESVKESRGVTKPVNLAIMGRWGIGKTSTLYKFKDILANDCKNAKVFSSIISLKPASCSDADTFCITILEALYRDYKTTAKLSDKIKNFIKNELDDLENWKITKVSISPEFERKPKTIRAVNFKDSLLRFWKQLESNNFDLAIMMLDDIQYALTENAELLYNLRTDMQALSAEGARFMFIITGPMSIYPEMSDKAEPFTRLFEKFPLESFDLNGTRELIEKPLNAEQIDLTILQEVVKQIHNITEGHPYFVILVMRDLVNKKHDGIISLKEFTQMYPDLTEHFAKVKFDDDFNKATDAEKEVLYKMAKNSKEELNPRESGREGSAKLLERLVKKELVIKIARGKYKLYNKLFKEYLRKKKK